jgi:hypothetical protein
MAMASGGSERESPRNHGRTGAPTGRRPP